MSWPGVARLAVQRHLTTLDVFDRIVANSDWVAQRLRAEGVRIDGSIPNGVPVRPPRARLGAAPIVGFAGRLVRKKGVDVLLRAMARLRGRVPEARLIVAGDGPERAPLERLAVELRIREAVDFVGHLPQAGMEQALGTAWVQAVPSRWEEPFGLVAAEAMIRGTAVVASSGGGLAEQVVVGETGFLAPAGDAHALAAALETVVRDRDLAERLGAAARVRALSELTLDRHVERVLAAHAECLSAGRR
jgi:glycosyltransferase involved in cell wall biosynthesis